MAANGKITRNSFAWALSPAINRIYEKMYMDTEINNGYIDQIFKVGEMDGATEEFFTGLTGLGPMRVKQEGDAIQYDSPGQGRPVMYRSTTLALAIRVTHEMNRDNRIGLVSELTQMMAISAKQTPELDAALVIAMGFGAVGTDKTHQGTSWSATTQTYVGPDGVSLFHSAHPIEDAPYSHRDGLITYPSTWSNLVSGALNETNLTVGLGLFKRIPNAKGQPSRMKCDKIVYPTDLEFEVKRLLNSTAAWVSPVDNASANANEGIPMKFGKPNLTPLCWEVLPDGNDCFLFGSKSDPRYKFRFLWREHPGKPVAGEDYDTMDAKYRVHEAYACGYDDARGVVGFRA